MAIMRRFCFCCNLRSGSMFVATYSLLSSAFFIALLLIRNIGYRIVDTSIVHAVVTYGSFVLFGLLMLVSVGLIIGIHQVNRWMFVPWLVQTLVSLIFATGAIVWLIITIIRSTTMTIEGWEISLVVFHSVNMICTTYCVLCVISLFQDITVTASGDDSIQRRPLSGGLSLNTSGNGEINHGADMTDITPRPPPMSVLAPPPYWDKPPPDYTTFPRGLPVLMNGMLNGEASGGVAPSGAIMEEPEEVFERPPSYADSLTPPARPPRPASLGPVSMPADGEMDTEADIDLEQESITYTASESEASDGQAATEMLSEAEYSDQELEQGEVSEEARLEGREAHMEADICAPDQVSCQLDTSSNVQACIATSPETQSEGSIEISMGDEVNDTENGTLHIEIHVLHTDENNPITQPSEIPISTIDDEAMSEESDDGGQELTEKETELRAVKRRLRKVTPKQESEIITHPETPIHEIKAPATEIYAIPQKKKLRTQISLTYTPSSIKQHKREVIKNSEQIEAIDQEGHSFDLYASIKDSMKKHKIEGKKGVAHMIIREKLQAEQEAQGNAQCSDNINKDNYYAEIPQQKERDYHTMGKSKSPTATVGGLRAWKAKSIAARREAGEHEQSPVPNQHNKTRVNALDKKGDVPRDSSGVADRKRNTLNEHDRCSEPRGAHREGSGHRGNRQLYLKDSHHKKHSSKYSSKHPSHSPAHSSLSGKHSLGLAGNILDDGDNKYNKVLDYRSCRYQHPSQQNTSSRKGVSDR